MALSRISAGLLPDSLACTPSRAAVRPSLVPKSAASALMSSFGPEVLASSNAHPLDRLSFRSPHKPLGSAAVTASPAIMGLSKSLVHSSGVKLGLLATADLLWARANSRGVRAPQGTTQQGREGSSAVSADVVWIKSVWHRL